MGELICEGLLPRIQIIHSDHSCVYKAIKDGHACSEAICVMDCTYFESRMRGSWESVKGHKSRYTVRYIDSYMKGDKEWVRIVSFV